MGRREAVTEGLRCEIFPADLDVTVEFYERVMGFELVSDQRDSAAPYVYMERGGVRLGALQSWQESVRPAARRPPAGVELVFEVADLDAERKRIISAGWPLDEDVVKRPWGLRDCRLLDPDGYYWRITTR